MNMKKLFLLNLPYLLFVYPFDKLAQAFRLAPGADLSGKLLSIGDGFTAAFFSPWLSFHPTDQMCIRDSRRSHPPCRRVD